MYFDVGSLPVSAQLTSMGEIDMAEMGKLRQGLFKREAALDVSGRALHVPPRSRRV